MTKSCEITIPQRNTNKMAMLSNSLSFAGTLVTDTTPTTSTSGGSSRSDTGFNVDLLSNILDKMSTSGTLSSTAPGVGSFSIPSSNPSTIPSRQNSVSNSLGRDFLLSNVMQNMGKCDDTISISGSPGTSSSLTSVSCCKCEDRIPTGRCVECNELYCHECVTAVTSDCFVREHTVIPLSQTSPLGGKFSGDFKDMYCEYHAEANRFYCEFCSSIICQECTLWKHKDHSYITLRDAFNNCRMSIVSSLESGKTGTKFIKSSIDRVVAISKSVEKDATDVTLKIKSVMRHFIMAIEDHEKFLIEKVDKMKQIKLSELSDQMHALRSALAGLAQTNEVLTKYLDLEGKDLFVARDKAAIQIEHFVNLYKAIQPKDETFLFIPPSYDAIVELKRRCDVLPSTYAEYQDQSLVVYNRAAPVLANTSNEMRRPVRGRNFSYHDNPSYATVPPGLAALPTRRAERGAGQCIPGFTRPIVAKCNRALDYHKPVKSFATEGHSNGQVSRPWGLCIDKEGNIVVADRRNNRIEIFDSQGEFKLKFGCKGTGPGEFDLPAGISTDMYGRIIVVDKDNHRVQIFSATGMFILKFGSIGRECGQFQYPWDVAVNSLGDILVTDSRNHRIQLFTSEGAFITKFNFEGTNPPRTLKGPTTPRGACFTPQGDIIVSDFENHRLLLVDAGLNNVISIYGREGCGLGEFSRPSGIVCDDEGRIVVADSKNHRVMVFSPSLEFLWAVEITGADIEEKYRASDVALSPDGHLVVVLEMLPEFRDSYGRNHIQMY